MSMTLESAQMFGGPTVPMNICVFCGARPGTWPGVTEAARQVGQLVAQRGHRLVYGAGGSGLMGEVAWSASRHGAQITGYTPRFLYERELALDTPDQTLHITEDMFERKRRMVGHADAFVALPGGYGTLDEILEILCLNSLEVTRKPLVLIDEAFWTPLLRLVESLERSGFADQGRGMLFDIAQTAADALLRVEELARAGTAVATGT
jgi:uncharacterized protein (TIGR00730 family)